MREVGRAVERIDDPALVATPRVRTALLGQNRGLRIVPPKARHDDRFARTIGIGHQIGAAALFVDFPRSPERFQECRPGFVCDG
ncbi:MAG: hypothetical protein WB615_04680 [Candidatus Tumulicola sp.]